MKEEIMNTLLCRVALHKVTPVAVESKEDASLLLP
jgi:hypothetical protein